MLAPAPAETPRTFNGLVPFSILPFRNERIEERFWSKVKKTPTCWIWQAKLWKRLRNILCP